MVARLTLKVVFLTCSENSCGICIIANDWYPWTARKLSLETDLGTNLQVWNNSKTTLLFFPNNGKSL